GYRLHARRCGTVERLDPFQQPGSGRQAIQYDPSVIALRLEPPRNRRVVSALHVPIGIVDAYAVMDIGHGSDRRDRRLHRSRSSHLRRSGWANADGEAQQKQTHRLDFPEGLQNPFRRAGVLYAPVLEQLYEAGVRIDLEP